MLDNVRNEIDGTLLRQLATEEQTSIQTKISYWEHKQIILSTYIEYTPYFPYK